MIAREYIIRRGIVYWIPISVLYAVSSISVVALALAPGLIFNLGRSQNQFGLGNHQGGYCLWWISSSSRIDWSNVGIVDDYRLEIVCHLFFALCSCAYNCRNLESPTFRSVDTHILWQLQGTGGAPSTTVGGALSFAQTIGFGMGYLQKRS
jgi:hypothetical protein